MEQNNVVNGELTTPQPSEGAGAVVPGETTPTAPGTKTDSNLLLKSLQEEREKRRLDNERMKLLEEEIEQLKSSAVSEAEAFSDEGKALESKIFKVSSEISELKEKLAKSELIASNPIFKDKWNEFEEFYSLAENKGMNLKTAAKAFLIENGLVEAPRKGLEKTTGGPRTPISSGMTAEEVKNLRETNYRKYQEMVKNGQIVIGQ